MNKLILLAVWSVGTFMLYAQPNFGVNRKDSVPCYKKVEMRSKSRYTEWECGKIAGVVNCNEKLEMSPNGKQVVTSSAKMPFTGICETCHMNGILERRVQFVNGYSNGIDTTFYKTSCMQVIRSHIQGVENGRWTYFYDSTQQVAWIRNYVMGQLEGQQLTFSKKGDTVKLENYVQGILSGTKKTYDENGKIESQSTYVKGVLEGPFLIFDKNGKIIEETNFKQGKKNGVFSFYYDDGTLLRTENWNMGQKNGEFKTLFYNQTIQSIESYKKDMKDGRFETRFANGKIRIWSIYKNNVLVEEHEFDELGKEIRTIGGKPQSGAEDDAMPTTKGKKEKKKKEKKAKKPKKNKEPKAE
ncbi:MAG TPA: toxin-antitoxin system YwqK family antitoxin [Fluviicola sp.]|nr:toxin-antitoxin system YwqK family antitoxin [Fluviicola sp.]